MPYRTRRPHLFKLSVQLLVFGLWIVIFGLVILYFSLQMMGALSTFEVGVLGAESGVGLDTMLVESVAVLYRGGFLTLGVGGVLMAFGSMFIVSIVR